MKPEDLIAQAEYQQHPYGKVWQPFDEHTFADLVADIDRRGLDKEITLYQGQVLEGWHRYLACVATKTKPKFAEFKGTDLEAAELVNASGIRRHSSADQRYASFLQLCEACPAFKEKFEQLEQKAAEQQKSGKALDTDSQRVDVVKEKAKAAGVSKATAKKVEKVKKAKPGAVAEIAAGKTTANKELKTLPNKTKAKSSTKAKDRGQKAEPFKPGDKLWRVVSSKSFPPSVRILRYTIAAVREDVYATTVGEAIPATEALTLDAATAVYKERIKECVSELTEAVTKLKAAIQKKPRFEVMETKTNAK